MVSRTYSARHTSEAGISGQPQLTFAQLIVWSENILKIFVRPLAFLVIFIALAWLGVFSVLPPWVHLVALAGFVLFFFDACGKAHIHWKPISPSIARRRVEEASGLRHRPLDVITDRPATLDEEQWALWQVHAARAQEQVQKLRWPKWKPVFADHDHYAVRYALLILLMAGMLFGWGALGGKLIAAINPEIAKLQIIKPALDAWITPPAYTHMPPIMIATPAGMRHDGDVIEVPEGSTITAHLAEKDGDAPELVANGELSDFTSDSHGDFEASGIIRSGNQISIRRGWHDLGSWHIHVVPDLAPQVAFTDSPSATEHKTVRLAYEATDDYGVTSVSARITPRESLPGASNEPLDIPLGAPDAKQIKRITFEDLTAHPWSGLPVQIQLVATDAAGHTSISDAVDFTLPERIFFQPIARALIEERQKLLQNPDDDSVRNEAANVMAGIAHQPTNYRSDPVVLMALRSGAVRLVLDHSRTALASANDILWQTAIRIEDGVSGLAAQNLRQAQKDLANALDRNASEKDIQKLIDRLHQAMAQYLTELSTRMASRPGPVEDFSQALGQQANILTPRDLDRMLEQMRNLSASGNREAAQQALSRLQQLLENLRTERPQFTEEQKQQIRNLQSLRELTKQQQQLLDKTFRSAEAHDGKDTQKLSSEQSNLLHQLKELMKGLDEGKSGSLERGANAMQQADGALKQGAPPKAVPHQTEAVAALQNTAKEMADALRSSMMMLPHPGMGALEGNSDPFGRNVSNLMNDDGTIKVPDQMETRKVREILDELQRRASDMARPKTERDYIDRLLQNF